MDKPCPKGSAVAAIEFAMSLSLGLNHCAANWVGEPVINTSVTAATAVPNIAT